MSDSLLLQAFQGTNKTIPVWFMRQAGRYLPGYRAIKAKHSLQEMFISPEIATQVTCMPIDVLGVDAAILFADILTLPSAMGFDVSFINGVGPVISNPILKREDVHRVHDFVDLSYVARTIRLVNERLSKNIPLIGFAGSPFTVACYLLEGGSAVNFNKTLHFAHRHPESFHQLLKVLTRNTIAYLNFQKEAGIKVFQLFDTWSGILRPADYAHWSLAYVKEIFAQVKLPSIYYLKNAAHLMPLMEQSGADFLSVCQTILLGHEPVLAKNRHGVQGNLFNGLLYAQEETLKEEVHDVLLGTRQYHKYIFNLSHGVFPDVDPNTLKRIVDWVHEFPRNE